MSQTCGVTEFCYLVVQGKLHDKVVTGDQWPVQSRLSSTLSSYTGFILRAVPCHPTVKKMT
jgi:hypothetical protein